MRQEFDHLPEKSFSPATIAVSFVYLAIRQQSSTLDIPLQELAEVTGVSTSSIHRYILYLRKNMLTSAWVPEDKAFFIPPLSLKKEENKKAEDKKEEDKKEEVPKGSAEDKYQGKDSILEPPKRKRPRLSQAPVLSKTWRTSL